MRPYIQNMLDGADRAAKLTDGLLAFSRKQLITKRPVDIVAIVRKAEKLIARIVGEDIGCTATLPAEEILVLADASQIEQVLMNLATNARDAMPHGGTFTVAVERVLLDEAPPAPSPAARAGTYAVISATDTGSGHDRRDPHAGFSNPSTPRRKSARGRGSACRSSTASSSSTTASSTWRANPGRDDLQDLPPRARVAGSPGRARPLTSLAA